MTSLYKLKCAHVVGKRDMSEDLVIIGRDIYAVVDGVTDKHGDAYESPWSGRVVTSGRFAAEVVGRALMKTSAQDARGAVDAVTEALFRALDAQRPGLMKSRLPGASFMAFVPSRGLLFGVGDCKAAWTQGTDTEVEYCKKRVDDVAASFRAAVIAATGWDGVGTDVGRTAIMALLEIQANLANELGEWGYGVINGTQVLDEHIIQRRISPDRLVLASDGYPELVVKECLEHEAAELRLAELLRVDPLCVRELMGTKGLEQGRRSFDDRAWLEIAKR